MPALEPEVTRALALRAIDGALLRLKWLAAATRFEIALHRHDRALKYACKYGYNPAQPRVPAGDPAGGQWTSGGSTGRIRLAGGIRAGGGLRGRFGAGSFPGSTYGQRVRLDLSTARMQRAIMQVRQYQPNWNPSTESVVTTDGIEGAIRNADAIAEEAQARFDQLRRGIGGNFAPPLNPNGLTREPNSRVESDGQMLIRLYRIANNMPDLLGQAAWPLDEGTVAVTEMDGRTYYGINAGAPGYSSADRAEANAQRWALINSYPDVMETRNIGEIPNNSLYHAEATVLLRAASENDGSLAGRSIEVHVDRIVCGSCRSVLPYLGLRLGNPVVTYVDKNGDRLTMWNGSWLSGR